MPGSAKKETASGPAWGGFQDVATQRSVSQRTSSLRSASSTVRSKSVPPPKRVMLTGPGVPGEYSHTCSGPVHAWSTPQ